MFQVSVVVLTYNPEWIDLKRTLFSIVTQKNVSFEIVIADDGSVNCCASEIRDFLSEYSFSDYIIVNNESNQGTVKNYLSALSRSSAEYVKPISPGDYLYDENSLNAYYSFAKKQNAKAVFADAVYYSPCGANEVFDSMTSPRRKDLFQCTPYPFEELIKQFSLHDDGISGAVMFMDRITAIEIMNEISSYVKCVEDLSNTILLCRKIPIFYLAHPCVWYQYGSGISTSKGENGFSNVKAKDFHAFWAYINSQYIKTLYMKRVVLSCEFWMKRSNYLFRVLRILVCPERKIRNKRFRYLTKYEKAKLDRILLVCD